MHDGNGDARHQQIDDEHRLGLGPVDPAESPTVERKAARERQCRQMPLTLLCPGNDAVYGLHGGLMWFSAANNKADPARTRRSGVEPAFPRNGRSNDAVQIVISGFPTQFLLDTAG